MAGAVLSIAIDSREPPGIRDLDFAGLPKVVTTLETGDCMAVCEDGAIVLIERKTPNDLISSIIDGRLADQAARLQAATPWSYVVVHGVLAPAANGKTLADGRQCDCSWAAVQGALLSAQELGIVVVYCAGAADYAPTVLRIAHHDRGAVRISPRRPTLMQSDAETILTSLPGIGETHARGLLEYCQTAAWALAYLTSDERPGRVRGVGPITMQKAREALGLEDWACLRVLPLDWRDNHIPEIPTIEARKETA